jgi:pilus assembly protein CpaB
MTRTRVVVLTLITALVFGALASVSIFRYLQGKEAEIRRAKGELQTVVVASQEIPAGATLTPDHVKAVMWPKSSVPAGTSATPQLIIGRLAVRDIVPGEPILDAKLAPTDVTTGVMTFRIPEGMRAMTVAVDQVSGVAGFILPDSRVDVIVTTTPPRSSKRSKTILQNMQVLAVGQILEQREGKPVSVPTVTLAVTPQDAEKLAMATNEGRLQFVLRKFGEKDEVKTRGTTVWGMLRTPGAYSETKTVRRAAPAKPVVVEETPAPAPKSQTVEIIRHEKNSVKKAKEEFVKDAKGDWQKKAKGQ